MLEKTSCLLPNTVEFIHYDLTITPNLQDFTFRGEALISMKFLAPTRRIVLHAAELTIAPEDICLWFGMDIDDHIPATQAIMDKKAETVTIELAEETPEELGTLEITYTGVLNDKMAGFYRSKYTSADGTEKYLATTQFEATDARRALPCGDEPALKATFDVCLVVPEGMTALSNMPVRTTTWRDDGLVEVRFDRTPVMSTYLLAMIVGDLEYTETFTNNQTRIRVYSVQDKSSQGAFALETARRVLEFYNEYFRINYPLPKLDMIAIPDFAAGAMENWGLVTYRENSVLIDPANSSSAAYQCVAEVVAHELAHMWFGNLVTMQWWTHLWLNEGFATWMAAFAMDALFPEWDIWTQFVSDAYANALSLDGLRSSHPIEVEVGHPDEISQIFDAISYYKGASIIRMIHDYIGALAFRSGLHTYLMRHAYNNATTEDLWTALSEESSLPVHTIMDTWTKQAGYPLITVHQQKEFVILANQERFLAGGDELSDTERNQRWQIPLPYHVYDTLDLRIPYRCIWTEEQPPIGIPENSLFVKLNSGQITPVRVNYTPEQWIALANTVRFGKLPAVDQYGLLSDCLSLARAGKLHTGQIIELLPAYRDGDNYTVWNAALGALGALDGIIEGTRDEQHFNAFALSLVSTIVKKLGWDEQPKEKHTTQLLRGAVLGIAGAYGDDAVFREASRRLGLHIIGHEAINPNLRSAVYNIVARQGVAQTFVSLTTLHANAGLQEEKARLLRALGQFRDPSIIDLVLAYTFDTDSVRAGDVIYALSAMGSHPAGRRAAWAYLVNNWDMINERYSGGGLKMLGHIIDYICGGFASSADADTVEKFFAGHPAPSASRAIAESLERIRIRAAWYRRDESDISKALSAY